MARPPCSAGTTFSSRACCRPECTCRTRHVSTQETEHDNALCCHAERECAYLCLRSRSRAKRLWLLNHQQFLSSANPHELIICSRWRAKGLGLLNRQDVLSSVHSGRD